MKPASKPVVPNQSTTAPVSAFKGDRSAYVRSPPTTTQAMDDFAAEREKLHDSLFRQKQYLQAQQDYLRSQLAAQQHSHEEPTSAPLVPGYISAYRPRFASSPFRQRGNSSQQGTSRQGMPESVPSTGSMRGSSQPSRASPHPLLVQQLAQQGFDMQALGLGADYTGYGYQQAEDHTQHTETQHMPVHLSTSSSLRGSIGNERPQHYVNYYVGGNFPDLGPQRDGTNEVPVTPSMPALREFP